MPSGGPKRDLRSLKGSIGEDILWFGGTAAGGATDSKNLECRSLLHEGTATGPFEWQYHRIARQEITGCAKLYRAEIGICPSGSDRDMLGSVDERTGLKWELGEGIAIPPCEVRLRSL